ncbi:MAG: tetratricopeptide repeat protein, partial [Thermoanaerobaculales bacterium]|nr:tetratricopeptide repeat protein [Thermoanaerobaculales bacterium]
GYFKMSEPLLTEALAVQREILGNDHPEVGRTLFTIGWLAFWQGDLARSLDSFEEAATILEKEASPTDQLPLTARTAAGFLMGMVGNIEGATETLDKALEAGEAAFGRDSAAVADVLLFSGNLHFDAGRVEEAGQEWERAVSIRRVVFGEDHQQYAFAISNLSRYLRAKGQLEESRRLLESAIEIFERTYGPDHPALAHTLGAQGMTLRSLEDYEGAIRHFERAAAILKELFGPDHTNLSWITRGLAGVYLRMGNLAEAEAIARESLRISEAAYGKGHLECARSHFLIGYVEYKLERYPESRQSYETSLAIRQNVLPANHPGLASTFYNLACILALEGFRDRALETLQMSLDAGFANPLVFDDPDLDTLRGDPEFEEMVREIERRIQLARAG